MPRGRAKQRAADASASRHGTVIANAAMRFATGSDQALVASVRLTFSSSGVRSALRIGRQDGPGHRRHRAERERAGQRRAAGGRVRGTNTSKIPPASGLHFFHNPPQPSGGTLLSRAPFFILAWQGVLWRPGFVILRVRPPCYSRGSGRVALHGSSLVAGRAPDLDVVRSEVTGHYIREVCVGQSVTD